MGTLTITRIGYCVQCAGKHKPKTGQSFIVYGGTHHSYSGMNAKRNGKAGYTPHLYEFIKVLGSNVYYQKLCCMNECGTYLVEENKAILVCTDDEKWSAVLSMTLDCWNALVLFKNTGFEI